MLFIVHFAGVNPRTNLAQERGFKGMLRRHVTVHLDGIEVLVAVRTHVGTGFADGTACRGGGGVDENPRGAVGGSGGLVTGREVGGGSIQTGELGQGLEGVSAAFFGVGFVVL